MSNERRPEPFVVKHYSSDERPIIKGNGFDGLEIGEDREEAEAFIAWVNSHIAAGSAMNEALKLPPLPPEEERSPFPILDVWRAALTLANNLCVQISDRHNDDDETSEASAASECAKRIRDWLHPSPDDLWQMLREAGVNVDALCSGRSDDQMHAYARAALAEQAASIDMILHCPKCGMQHIDAPECAFPDRLAAAQGLWTNPPHRSHLCHGCGHIWRPADVPTNGVAAIQTKGKNDSPPVAEQAAERDATLNAAYAEGRRDEREEREEAEADARRLDWMSNHEAWIGWNRDGDMCSVWTRSHDEEDPKPQPMCGWGRFFDDQRAAIDAAMETLGAALKPQGSEP